MGLAAWLLPSIFSAERYRRRMETGLERTLQRPAKFGAVSFRLLPRPGFSLENVTVLEDPAFGLEPFAHVDRVECDLRWRSLWQSRLDFARLRLENASFNLVRNELGEWNVGRLLFRTELAAPRQGATPQATAPAGEDFEFVLRDARLDFKVGTDKKPFALTDVQARLTFEPARGRVRYRLAATPLRTDLSVPTPGAVEMSGEWTPGKDLEGPIQADIQTRGALLYNWVPLLTGRNPEIYGVLDANLRVSGSIHLLHIEGEGRLAELHRWEQLPPSDPMPWTLRLRGQFDRRRGRAVVESLEASFRDSHIHVSGAVDQIPASPQLDLVVALERSRLEDLEMVARRLWQLPDTAKISGRIDALLAIQGSWTKRRYGGLVGAREVRIETASGNFPVSEVAVRIDRSGARLAPLRITLAPRVELMAEGGVEGTGNVPQYHLDLSAKAVPLHDVLSFGRDLGFKSFQGVDAQGVGTATFRLAGSAWPFSAPSFKGRAEIRAARLLVPGMTEPINLPRARVQVSGDEIVADPVVAVLGTSIFSARLSHRGERTRPWEFDLRANALSLGQGSLWFDALGRRKPLPLLERLPGLGSLDTRRAVASNLFGVLNARGHFSTPALTYRALTLRDFRAAVEISGRVIRLDKATFRAGGGHGQGNLVADLTRVPARLTADLAVSGVAFQALVPRLPPALQGARGTVSASGRLASRGLTREEVAANLEGQATLRLKDVVLGDFDPLEPLARRRGGDLLEPPRGPVGFHEATVALEVANRQVTLRRAQVDISGAKLVLSGSYAFDGTTDLEVRADFRRVKRRWLNHGEDNGGDVPVETLRLVGPLQKLVAAPESEVSRRTP